MGGRRRHRFRGDPSHFRSSYGRDTVFIPYSAAIIDLGAERLGELGLEPGGFHLVVARFEPENHVRLIVEGFRRSNVVRPLVLVGAAPYSTRYVDEVGAAAAGDPHIRFVGSVWDQDLLNQLYANCTTYLHGHSVGGTNPSLLRAMGVGAPVLAYDVVFPREVAGDTARYFATEAEVASLAENAEREPGAERIRGKLGRERVQDFYDWDDVATQYADVASALAVPGPQKVARSRGPASAVWTSEK